MRRYHGAAFAAALATCACSTALAQDKSTIVIAIPGTPQGIDIDRQSGPQTWTIGMQVLELGAEWATVDYPFGSEGVGDPRKIPGFKYPDFTGQKMDSGIIESCKLSEDGLSATYHLRPNVRSAAGNEFTADDVIYRVERAIANNAITQFIQNSVNAGKREQWSVVDKYTVAISAQTPMPQICTVLTNPYFYWLDSVEAKKHATSDDPWSNAWVSTGSMSYGPYHVVSWDAGRRIELVANPNYWRGEPEIKRVIYQVVPESANRVALLAQGKVQLAEGLSPDEIVSLAGVSSVRVAAVRGNQSLYAIMNNAIAPFDKPEVRQAINMVLPREAVAEQIYRGMAEPFYGVIPSLYPGYVDFRAEKGSLKQAMDLLAKADLAEGFDTQIAYSAGDPVQENVAILMQTALRQIGIRVNLQKMPVAAHSDLVQSKKAPFALWLDFPIQPDPNYALGLIYGTSNAVNYQNYSNAAVDDDIAKGVPIVSPAERAAAHETPQRQIHNDAALGWIVEPYFLTGMASSVEGWRWYPTQYYRVNDLSLK
ncbi:ABC transporter substrate-binding protein (plasmid) [Aminobacter sp. SR38]|jgi:peptide/nickel transport system substrate-binding protein|uniref:ABC transporter substrate-binding protein n=1 Tax=Aminobacter sp. SR38 TaxID=2774562 RepID=UPI00177C60B2|nr:ABC transporter substrate-binding protein [Aminobacter sp. SR38]QOF75503.1 ABC transporter substrate-binding protein [Aminobacter sp. SR38]